MRAALGLSQALKNQSLVAPFATIEGTHMKILRDLSDAFRTALEEPSAPHMKERVVLPRVAAAKNNTPEPDVSVPRVADQEPAPLSIQSITQDDNEMQQPTKI